MHVNTNLNTAARIAGLGYFAIIVCGILAEFVLRGSLIEAGNPAETARNIAGSESLFRLSILSDVVMLIFDAVVAVALFALFRSVSPALNVASAAFRLLHTAVYGVTILFLFFAVQLATSPEYLSGLTAAQTGALGSLFIEAHAYGYAFALFFFAVHLALLGVLVARSGYVPKVLGLLLVFAALGYLTDGVARTMLSNYADHEAIFGTIVVVPALIGEFTLSAWLVFKGVTTDAATASTATPARAADPIRI
jgi:hypothetical protein